MPRRRFFISQNRIRGGVAVLTSEETHHLRDVLRLRAGEEVELFDGEGFSCCGKVVRRGAEIHVEALDRLEPQEESPIALVLAAALIKADRFEWLLQKGTELGVDQFVPLETKFTTVRIPPARLQSRLERWQRIVREASKQSRRITIPKINEPLPWNTFLASPEYAMCARFMLHERASRPLKVVCPTIGRVLLCVGPEGGWDDSEASQAENAGFRVVNMGSRILRSETAAIAAVAVFQFLLRK